MAYVCRQLAEHYLEPAFVIELAVDDRLRLTEANPAWLRLMGLDGMPLGGLYLDEADDKAPLAELAAQLRQCIEAGEGVAYPSLQVTAQGERHLQTTLTPLRDISGRVCRVLGNSRDVSKGKATDAALQRQSRELHAISDCNQALLRVEDEQSLLDEICRIICEVAGYRMAWVGFAEYGDDKHIRPVAWAGEESGYLEQARLTWADTERGQGASGAAIRGGESVSIQDFMNDPRAAPWRDSALARSFRSSIALPLKDEAGATFGLLNIYAAEPHAFTPDESRLMQALADDLAFGITVLRGRQQRKQVEAVRLSNLFFFQSMDKVNRAIQGARELEQMMSDVLDQVLEIFACDRAYLLHPCDPDADSWQVPMERTRPAYPGALALGHAQPMNEEVSKTLRVLLNAEGPVQFGEGAPYPIPPDVAERFGLKNFMSLSVWPKVGDPWQFGIHQCAYPRRWSREEERLLREIGLRLADGLTSMLIFRDLQESGLKLREAERQFHTLVDNLPDCIARFDRDYQTLFVNQATTKAFGFSAEDVVGKGSIAITGPGTEGENKILEKMIAQAFERGVPNTVETRWHTVKGIRYFDVMHLPEKNENGQVVSVLGVGHDITERKLTEQALRSSEEKYRRIVDTASEGIWAVSAENLTTFVNARMADMLGCASEELVGRPMETFMFKADAAAQEEQMTALRQGSSGQYERRFRRKDGEALWTRASATPIYSAERQYMGAFTMFTDITAHKRQQEQLLYQAHFDPLTGLPNRFLSMDRLEQHIRESRRSGRPTALLYLDLDDFKKVNDALGHEVGDQVLISAAIRLSNAVRAVDTVGRLGGDEFVVLIHDISKATDVCPVAEKILQAFQEVIPVMGRQVMLTASLGISIFPEDGEEPLVLLRNADTAMYHSKAMGRNAYHFFTESMNQNVARRLQLEEQLRLALQREEFHLVYQPIIEVATGAMVRAEVLLRWKNSLLGEVMPDEFIDVAEQSGLIISIGEWVMKTAIAQLALWQDRAGRDFRLALNVSPRQFRQAGFVAMLQDQLQAAGLAGAGLELEVTEGVLLSGELGAAQVLSELQLFGVNISMDDFGTGYSSLNYLRNYRFDTLKIDRSFIRDINIDANDRALITATLRMAKSLGVRVVAEGVETPQQFAFLRQEGCEFAQGYYLSRPVAAQRITEIIERNLLLGCDP